jgi:hypothetical protein
VEARACTAPTARTISSGGPSSASSSLCSCPMREVSHTRMRRSAPDEANTDSLNGAHDTAFTSSVWPRKEWTGTLVLRRSHMRTCLSVPPERR